MVVKALIDKAIDSYKGNSLECVLIGADLWPKFLKETGLIAQPVNGDDVEVYYRGIACRPSVTPDTVNLLIGD